MTKTSLLKLLREVLDTELGALGFRWRRMWKSSDGWYVRRWEAGSERIGISIVTHHPEYKVSPFVTTALDPVAELICPLLGYVDPEAMKDFSDHNFNFSPFTQGPPGDLRAHFRVTTEEEARRAAREIGDAIRGAIDPWLIQHRSPVAMFELVHTAWRNAGPIGEPLHSMVELALAWLSRSVEEARLRSETLAKSQGWPPNERAKIERLIAEIDRRRS